MANNGTPVMSAVEQFAGTIREQIRFGEFAPGAKLPPLRTLTGQFNTSHTTIIRAMEILAAEGFLQTRERDGTYVSDRTNWKADSLVVRILSGGDIGPVSVDFRWDRPHLRGIDRVSRELTASGSSVSFQSCVCYPYGNAVREYVPLRRLGAESADALLAVGLYDMSFLATLHELQKPVIVYDLDASSLRMDSACIDDAGSAFEMTSMLVKRGFRKIAFLGGQLNTRDRQELWNYDPCLLRRADGYTLAMRAHGLPAHVFFDEHANGTQETIRRAQTALPGCEAFVTKDLTPAFSSLATPGTAVATWIAKGTTHAWPGLAILAECDFEAMGEAVLKLLEERLANPKAPIQRTVLRPAIRVWKEGKSVA